MELNPGMNLEDFVQEAEDYQRVEQALLYLEQNFRRQPELGEIAAHIGLSEYHFQRLFTRWAGISPKRFLQYLTKEYAARLLAGSTSVLEASLEAGLSGPGRLHDLFVTCEAVTPGEYKQMGAGLEIRYGFHPSPFGICLLAATRRGVCHLAFAGPDGKEAALQELHQHWPGAVLVEDLPGTHPFVRLVFNPLHPAEHEQPLRLLLKGTNFQIKVWEALLRIPSGSVVSYEGLATALGAPSSARALAGAVARNPLPVIIPCHRVIRKLGEPGGYRYGMARKLALLGREFSKQESMEAVIG
jgi:AraC family transcriptional regulator, regulatory protein of adaptative response / methylated-DNA-[protein]-cysteine methyltransferase